MGEAGVRAITIGLSFLAILIARKSFSLTLGLASPRSALPSVWDSSSPRSALRARAGNFNSIDKMKGGETR